MRLGHVIRITSETPPHEFGINLCTSCLPTVFHSGCRFIMDNQLIDMCKLRYTLACSNSSRRRTPAPSPITNPSRLYSTKITL
ncbi:hypothetical protein Hanom_Chr06g00579191 [Helianthus anomalus]